MTLNLLESLFIRFDVRKVQNRKVEGFKGTAPRMLTMQD
jgi:hypothetical protein